MSQWLLPENLQDFLPSQAKQLEFFRRALLDLYASKDYQFVMPSLLEYEDSLNAHGKDLDLDTYKVVDQLSGKMMGVSSDLTTQAARIDAYLCNDQKINKLCYAGPVIRTKSSIGQSRELFQIGLECFGDERLSADIEVQTTLIESLKLLNIKDIVFDINHLDVYRLLISKLDITPQERRDIDQAITLKDKSALHQLLNRFGKNDDAENLVNLIEMFGDKTIIQKLNALVKGDQNFDKIISDLNTLVKKLEILDIKLSFDFSDIRGYQYHSGLIFSAYSPGFKSVIAQGGRYDNLNKSLGIKRPATGFSMDLKYLVSHL